jgi:hypothetical protein
MVLGTTVCMEMLLGIAVVMIIIWVVAQRAQLGGTHPGDQMSHVWPGCRLHVGKATCGIAFSF